MKKRKTTFAELDEQTKQELFEFVGSKGDYFDKKWSKQKKSPLSMNISSSVLEHKKQKCKCNWVSNRYII